MSNPSTAILPKHSPTSEQVREAIAANRTPLLILGIVLMLTGVGALAFPLAGSLAVDMIVASVFTMSGLIYFAHAFGTRSWGGFAWDIVVGTVYFAAGIFLFVKPFEGVSVLTAVIAISLIIDGIVRTAISFAMRRGPWGWVLASGVLSVLLGLAVFAMPAGNAVLLLGVLVGINMFASGLAFLMLGIRASAIEGAVERQKTETATPA